jgi:fatty-acyl-CoA synthase
MVSPIAAVSGPLLEHSGNQGLGSWPARRARMSPDSVALVQGSTSWTYAELAARVGRLAAGLVELGVLRGDRVAFLGANDLATFELFFATGSLGAIFVPLNTRLAAPELAYLLRDSGAEVLVVGRGVEGLARALMAEPTPVKHVVALDPAAGLDGSSYDDLFTAPRATPGQAEADVTLDDPALLLSTSGTTGRPKAAVLTHGNLTWNTMNQLAHVDVLSSDRVLCIAPLFHAVGLGQVTLPVLFKGGSVEVHARFDAGKVLAAVSERSITGFAAVPTMLQLMTEHPAWESADLSSLRYVVYGGSPVTERVAVAWLARGVRLQQGYGMTEAGPGIYMATRGGATARPLSVGVPHFFTDVALLGQDGVVGAVEPAVAAGELVVRGPHVFAGYWGADRAAPDGVVEGRWFRTGDVVRADETGWAYVVDRVKDMIISGGENIYPAEVEAALTSYDGIRSAAVVAAPHERWGEVGVAFVELDPDAVYVEEAVRRHLTDHLARYKIPRCIQVVEELPRNATGKIRRAELREHAGLASPTGPATEPPFRLEEDQ